MFTAKLAAASLFVATLVAPAVSMADVPPARPCFFHEHRVFSVSPVQVEEHSGKVTTHHLGGVELFVQAEPGLTAEWLRLDLSRRFGPSTGSRDCAFAFSNLRAEVDPAGTAFRVRVIASDSQTAEEVLRRSQQLAH